MLGIASDDRQCSLRQQLVEAACAHGLGKLDQPGRARQSLRKGLLLLIMTTVRNNGKGARNSTPLATKGSPVQPLDGMSRTHLRVLTWTTCVHGYVAITHSLHGAWRSWSGFVARTFSTLLGVTFEKVCPGAADTLGNLDLHVLAR